MFFLTKKQQMKKLHLLPFLILFAAGTLLFTSCEKNDDMVVVTPPPPPPPPPTPVVKPNQEFYGISTTNQLVKYNANASQTVISSVNVTGLQGGENILSIDL